MNLVAEYESSPEPDSGSIEAQGNGGGTAKQEEDKETAGEKYTNGKAEEEPEKPTPAKTAIALPSATSALERKTESSVLTNVYKKEEESKCKALEQHVKMVQNTKSVPVNGKVNGKVVCWMYRRGRCRLGKKCKMYHDSELRDAAAKQNSENKPKEQPEYTPSPQKRNFSEVIPEENDEQPRSKINKKHLSLSEDIVPPKKVLQHLETISKESQPGQ